jgi:hypothetical protein
MINPSFRALTRVNELNQSGHSKEKEMYCVMQMCSFLWQIFTSWLAHKVKQDFFGHKLYFFLEKTHQFFKNKLVRIMMALS